jgi:hypothetical protein
MAHARRMFNEALDNDLERATYVLEEMQKLYTIERISKEYDLNFEELKVVRCTKSATILKGLGIWMQ